MQVVVLWLLFASIAFGVRTLVQLRATGHTGWVVHRRRGRPIERIAAALFGTSHLASFSGALLAALGVASPLVQPAALPGPARAVGYGLYVLGVVFTFSAQLAMGRSWRIGVDSNERTELVAHGMFRLVRNPIYTAMLVTMGGLTLLCCSFVTCAAWAVSWLGVELQVRRVEEPYLIRTHGDLYLRYAAQVGRFVPLVGRRSQLDT